MAEHLLQAKESIPYFPLSTWKLATQQLAHKI